MEFPSMFTPLIFSLVGFAAPQIIPAIVRYIDARRVMLNTKKPPGTIVTIKCILKYAFSTLGTISIFCTIAGKSLAELFSWAATSIQQLLI